MRTSWSILTGVLAFSVLSAQTPQTLDYENNALIKPDNANTKVYLPEFGTTAPLRSLTPQLNTSKKGKEFKNDMRRFKHVNPDALPQNGDPILQSSKGTLPSRAPIANWQGTSSNSMPEDPSGAAGPNHYCQAINTQYEFFDKEGNSLYGPSNLSNLWSGSNNSGDPIVMYDQEADRWFIQQFQTSNNGILIAISQTPDPLGAYYTYSYTLSSFPDYPKFAIWHDGYYMTANISGQNFAVFNRDKMLAGDSSAEMIAKTLTVPRNGFYSVLPADADGDMPTGPEYFFYFQDDGWGGVSTDAINVYSMETNWSSVTATVALHQTIPVDAFDSEFTSSWDDITQQGSSQKLDGIPTALMYRVSYRNFDGYNSVVMCHTVDVNGSNLAGIRWYELRDENDGNWTLYQSGTYAPNDGLNRWCPSIGQDKWGNIGLGFAIAGSTAYPGLSYTGRRASDALGTMSIAEEVAIAGTGAITGANRFGDYGHLSMDPDEVTFWHTLEYGTSSGRRTRIYSFKIAQDLACDMGATSLTSPTDGILTSTETVTINITNFGVEDQSIIPVSYSVNGGTAVNEVYSGTIAPGQTVSYTFLQTVDLSVEGIYTIVTSTGIGCDLDTSNDSDENEVEHLSANNIGVTAITNPTTGMALGAETVTVTIENFGSADVIDFPVAYQLNGNTAVSETVSTTLSAGGTMSYNFDATVDLSTIGSYDIIAFTDLGTDANRTNDTTTVIVEHQNCLPAANCSFGDGFTNFTLEDINNDSGCGADGYEDYTDLMAELNQGTTHTITVSADYDEQQVSVWIDFNDNAIFEASEIVVTNYQHDGTGSTTFTLATNAPLGEHLLRARSNWQNPSDDACSDFEYGETEDYKVNISVIDGIEDLAALIDFKVLPINNTQQFNVVMGNLPSDMNFQVLNTIGQVVFEKNISSSTSNLTVDLSNEAAGIYMFKLFNNDLHKVNSKVIR